MIRNLSVKGFGLVKFSLLMLGSRRLVYVLPVFIRHAVNNFACFLIIHLYSPVLGCGHVPFRETIPAKPGQIHDVYVLDIRPFLKMGHQSSEGSGFLRVIALMTAASHSLDMTWIWPSRCGRSG